MTFISLLRGINVSGQKKILMSDLKVLYESLGYQKVRTYIQSGNVVFFSEETNTKEIANKIEEKISAQYNFEVPVLVLTEHEINATLVNNPFLNENATDTERLYVSFLSEVPLTDYIYKINPALYLPDRFIISEKCVFLEISSNGYGNTKLSNSFFESKLKVKSTTRNWKTLIALSKMG